MNGMLTQEALREVLDFNPETGAFTWLVRAARNVKPGDSAGGPSPKGYIHININGRSYKAHRLAWLWAHGQMPAMIDHKNGQGDDNRLCNLRPATPAQNAQNRRLHANNSSGLKNVRFNKAAGKYTAEITANRTRHFLGYFDTAEQAAAAAKEARLRLCGAYANHGKAEGAKCQ